MPLTYPATLTAGTPALAADVQGNFDAVKTLLDTTGLTTANLQSGIITNTYVNADANIAVSKLADGTSTQVLMNNADPEPTWTTLSGDVTVGATGVTAIGASKVTNTMMADNAIDTAELAAGAVETAKIEDLNVTTGKLADNAVTNAKIGDDAVDTAEIADGAVETAQLNDGAVTGAKITNYKVQRVNQTTNATETAALIQTGWKGVIGSDSQNLTQQTITFPTAYTNPPVVTATALGGSAGVPDGIDDFIGDYAGGMVVAPFITDITTTNFKINLREYSAAFTDATYYGFSWIAVGT